MAAIPATRTPSARPALATMPSTYALESSATTHSPVSAVPEVGGYLISESEGVIEWLAELGTPIDVGQPIALVHDAVRVGTAPVEYRATIDGILAMRHYPGLVKMGDAIAMQARSI